DSQWTLSSHDKVQPFDWNVAAQADNRFVATIYLNGVRYQATTVVHNDHVHVFSQGTVTVLGTHDPALYGEAGADTHLGGLTAPMPGKIITIAVTAGDTVKSGDRLLVMEAMKMEHTLHAPADGVVDEVFFSVGDQVDDGAELIA